jgi:hypothetical protein
MDLQEKLLDYNKNFESLNQLLGDASSISDNVASELRIEKTREMLTTALPVAVGTLIELCSSAMSENVRLNAAKYLIDRSLGKDVDIAGEDEATKILRRLIKSE